MSTTEPTRVALGAPTPIGTTRPTTPAGGWGALTVSVLGGLRTRPTETNAGSLTVPPDGLGEVSRRAVAAWLERAAAADWATISDFMVQAGGGAVVLDWDGGQASFHTWMALMGFGADD